jgi:ferredoxin
MEKCYRCVDFCRTGALNIKDKKECNRLSPSSFSFKLKDRLCNACGKCIFLCSIDKITIDMSKERNFIERKNELNSIRGGLSYRSPMDCINCFVCREMPLCIESNSNREDVSNFLKSTLQYFKLKMLT